MNITLLIIDYYFCIIFIMQIVNFCSIKKVCCFKCVLYRARKLTFVFIYIPDRTFNIFCSRRDMCDTACVKRASMDIIIIVHLLHNS